MRKLVAVCFALLGGVAMAQTTDTGSVRITGNVAPAISIHFGSSDVSGIETALTGGDPASTTETDPLNYTYNFGTITNATSGTFQRLRVNVRLRANRPYRLSATYQNLSPDLNGDGAPDASVPDTDVGFAIKAVTPTGDAANVVGGSTRPESSGTIGVATPAAGSGDIVSTTFAALGTTVNGTEVNGLPVFNSALSTIGTGADLVEGERISARGSHATPNNAVDITSEFAVLPQFLNPEGTFTYQVNFTAITL